MNANHTPGPWHVSKRNPLRVIESGPRGNSIARMGINLGVCSQEEAEANARLVAASPELLTALESMLQAWPYIECGATIAARAAIAKATGGAA